MTKDCILILGSGKSILDLTNEEREILNQCDVKIGINKYAAFYRIGKIVPTHVYFEDNHDVSSILMLKYIFNLLRKEKIKNLTFIVSENYKGFLLKSSFKYFFIKTANSFKLFCRLILVKFGRITLKKISVNSFNKYAYFISNFFKTKPNLYYNLVPINSVIQYINIKHVEKNDVFWAETLNEPLYHFKGSLSSVLNYISICFPNKTIFLVGVDLDSSEYFFEKELDELKFNTRDWTYELVKKHKKHYSIIETNGGKVDDSLPFILQRLKENNNKIYSLNEKSYLVKKGFVEKMSFK